MKLSPTEMEDNIMDAASMLQYDKFSYRGDRLKRGSKEGEYYFNDLRLPREQRDRNSPETERKIDKLLMTYEQILVLMENGMLDGTISVSYLEKIKIALRQQGIQSYLDNLMNYYSSTVESPYPRLISKLEEVRKELRSGGIR